MIRDAACPEAIALAVDRLKAGELVAIPTETVYGLAADASQDSAIAKIYARKARPDTNPLIVHIASASQLSDWASHIPASAYQLAAAFWPGPMTLILAKASGVSTRLTAGQETIGLRIPAHSATLALLQAFGGGLAAPSANLFTQLSPTTAKHVEQALGDDLLILDGGPAQIGIESTIIDCSTDQITILRPGMLSAAAISAVLGRTIPYSLTAELKRPGQHWLHYAPRTPLYVMNLNALKEALTDASNVAVIAYSKEAWALSCAKLWSLSPEPDAYARELYAALHALDAEHFQCILVESPPLSDAWHAVHERLHKAAGSTPSYK